MLDKKFPDVYHLLLDFIATLLGKLQINQIHVDCLDKITISLLKGRSLVCTYVCGYRGVGKEV